MNWKQFKKNFTGAEIDEATFVLGIDLGNETTSIAYYDTFNKCAEIIDLSGGYGKPSMPTVMEYVSATKEWIFGEYALQNGAHPGTVSNLVNRLGNKDYIHIDEKSLSVASVVAIFLKELIGSAKNLNPKANIVGIVAAVPSYFLEDAKDELLTAFKIAGFEKELIGLFTDNECVLNHFGTENLSGDKRFLMLDFGARAMRGAVFDARVKESDREVVASCVSSLFYENIGTNVLNENIKTLFSTYYMEETRKNELTEVEYGLTELEEGQIDVFVHQHKDLLFQKSEKAIRLYYNFAYPPFQKNIEKVDVDRLLEPVVDGISVFLKNVLNEGRKNEIRRESVDFVVCYGGGFEMLWAKNLLKAAFPQAVFYKNSKSVIALGACSLASSKLGITASKNVRIIDESQLISDIGIKVIAEKKQKFVPLAAKNSFWWQKHPPKTFLLNEAKDEPITIELIKRNVDGETERLSEIVLDGLPKRKNGLTKLKFFIHFESPTFLKITAHDLGFGDSYKKVEYAKDFEVIV